MRVGFTFVVLALAVTAARAQSVRALAPTNPPPPPNDLFSNAQIETGYSWSASGTIYGATRQRGEVGKAVWYSWTAPALGVALVQLDDNDPQGEFRVYSGTNILRLKRVKPIKKDKTDLLFATGMGTNYNLAVELPGARSNSAGFTLSMLLTSTILTEPTNGAAFRSSDTIPLAIDTTEVPSMVSTVKYFVNSDPPTQIGEADSSPYATTCTNRVAGQWNVYAELTRTDGYVVDTFSNGVIIRPYNDDFVNRRILSGTNISISDSMAEATVEPGEPAVNSNQLSGDIWYQWTAPGPGYVIIPYVYGNIEEGLNVFTGTALSNLTRIEITDNAANTIPFPVSAGETLQMAVFDMGDLSLTFYGVPANDDFASAIPLVGTNTAMIGNNLAATAEPGEPVPPEAGGHSVWYTWTAPTNGTLILEDTNSPIIFVPGGRLSPLVATVFTGDELTNLTAVATNGLGGPAYVPVWGGTTYHIALDNNATNYGVTYYAVQLSFSPAQPNDGFADRTVLTGDDVYFDYTSLGASIEPGEPPDGEYSLWWTWTAPYTGTALVSGIMYTPALGYAYTGDSLTNLVLVGNNNPYFLWSAQAGTTYQIAISSDSSDSIVQAGLELHYYTNGTPIEP